MNENLNTAKILIEAVRVRLKMLVSKSGLFDRTYLLDATISDATRTLNSVIEFIDAENTPTTESVNASSCCCKCCHCIRQQEAEEQQRMAAIGHQLGENLITVYDFFKKLKNKPPYKPIPYNVEIAMSNMTKLALRLDNSKSK